MKLHGFFIMALLLTMALPQSALADKGRGRDSDNSFRYYSRSHDDNSRTAGISFVIGHDDRQIIRRHLREDAFRNCPPGLAKKNPPCVPPGQAQKYRIGYPLEVGFIPVPDNWGLHTPRGYQYVQVDKDVLLIAEASKKVIDAVTLLSAVGN